MVTHEEEKCREIARQMVRQEVTDLDAHTHTHTHHHTHTHTHTHKIDRFPERWYGRGR
jgi:hypothetical protein